VLAFADVMDFLADELAGLRGWGFAGALVAACALERGLFWHVFLLSSRRRNCNAIGRRISAARTLSAENSWA
jgi:hypothetical protein